MKSKNKIDTNFVSVFLYICMKLIQNQTTMKLKLLLALLFSSSFLFATPLKKVVTAPSIAIILQSIGPSYLVIKIKNNGDESLTNIFVTTQFNTQIQSNLPNGILLSLAPGEENTTDFYANAFTYCPNQPSVSQVIVHATTLSGIEITDLSSDYDYYNNQPTFSPPDEQINLSVDGMYQDANNNAIVDIGDVVNFTYQVYNNGYDLTGSGTYTIYDANVAFTGSNSGSLLNNTPPPNIGVHSITPTDIELGYVTNGVYYSTTYNGCGTQNNYNNIYDPSPCTNCPAPINCINGSCIITRISPLLPNLISGTVKFNTSNNSCATGVGYPNRLVTTTSGANTFGSFTNASGNYSLYIPNTGSFATNTVAGLGAGFSSNPTNVTQVSSGENMNYPANFCISSANNVNDLSVVLIPIDHARPGFQSNYRLHYENNGTTSLSGTIKVTYNNGKLSFTQSYPTINSSTSNSLTWNFSNLLPYQYGDITITFTAFIPPTVNQDDVLTFTTLGTTTVTDANLADNTYALNQIVVSSFDPNDKTVLEGATITAAQATRPLNYLTRFQNTGTFAAVTVVLKETLDADLDWNTIEPTGSSHNYRIQIKNGNQLTVTFDAINLINSSANEPASHGWFAYKIKPKSTFAIGNVASSTASIYFDFNLPIVTNTVNTQIGTLATDGFDKNSFKIYPNPANNYFTIENNISKSSTYEIVTINGKTLSSGIVENLKPIDISELASGFYFVNIKTQDAKQTYKIVKE
jgi:hypothetical protein